MTDLRSFAKRLRYFANDIPKQANEIKKNVVQEIVNTIVPATPVRTGQARSGYFTTNGEASGSLPYGPFTQDGYQSIARARAAVMQAKPGVPMHITNNLPYIARLNTGYSTQAPAQFVEIAIGEARAIIRRQVIRYTGREQ